VGPRCDNSRPRGRQWVEHRRQAQAIACISPVFAFDHWP